MTTGRCCKAITAKGKPCKNPALEGSDFCHLPSHRSGQEQVEQVGHFLEKHKEATVGFLAGVISDPVVSDLYDYLKQQLGMKHLVPPVSAIQSLSERYKEHNDAASLELLAAELRLGMTCADVESLLGGTPCADTSKHNYFGDFQEHILVYFGRDGTEKRSAELGILIHAGKVKHLSFTRKDSIKPKRQVMWFYGSARGAKD